MIFSIYLNRHVFVMVGISQLNANNIDPDQTQRSVASDLGVHCLPMSHLWDARLKWVKTSTSVEAR